jgi:hypothetical protein
MTSTPQSSHEHALGGELVVVTVTDTIDMALTGRGGWTYESPPQSREQALSLVGLLLGRRACELDGQQRWSCPVAGGRRAISVELIASCPAPEPEALAQQP